ncbi:MAG: ABC transporter permease [Gammaproteobacteria bacterium]|nr:ABC transporter permease [Gammaproteobacteria bacterium]NNF48330.1 ABC transporter permease [Woeseiaceae bacterium]MBT8093305.1 ABC transporter permease [Gammaproteobacteria bacterium]MBT8106136.1 ABC transporter permease [Gammaproteobacteria bacterium]NNK26150.1 ABC transporter permease [Woeseiaceae bacterium]
MLRYYLKLGFLSIRANPALSLLMVAAIAVGIGACMTMVTVRHVMADNPIAHKNDRLFHVQVDNWNPNNPYREPNEPPEQVTYLDATRLLEAGRAHRQVISFKSDRVVQPDDDEILPFQEEVRATSADFFAMFDVPFKYGSGWDAAADRAEERVTVLSAAMNDRLYGGEDSTGRMLMMNNEPYRVAGVLDDWRPTPKFFDLNNNPYEDPEDIYTPFSVAVTGEWGSSGNNSCWKSPEEAGYASYLASECIWIQMWVELPTQADKEAYEQFLADYVTEQKELGRFPRPLNNRLSTPEEWMINQEVVDDMVSVLLALSALFLLVCLLNTIGLLLAKVIRRRNDISLRRALGASKAELFRQYIVEAGMIGGAGGLAGIGMTWLGLRGIENVFSEYDFIEHLVTMDWQMVGLAVLLAIVSSLGAALYPTWRACRVSPATTLRIQ